MSVVVLINGREVSVTGPHADIVAKSPKMLARARKIDPSFCIESIEVQSATILANGSLLFATLKANVTLDGKWVPGVVFLCGGSVAVFPVIKMGGKTYTTLTVQARF